MNENSRRRTEIDLIRAVATIGMLVFHAVFDLDFFGIIHVDMFQGGFLVLARVVQLGFMLTTGMTLVLAHQKHQRLASRFTHALKLLFWAGLVTVTTFLLFGDQAIWFGVLHFYAVAVLLGLPFLGFKKWNLLFGALFLVLTYFLKDVSLGEGALSYVLGLASSRPALDYFPLLPWFGVFLFGMGLADFQMGAVNWPESWKRFLAAFTKKGLWIYLIHQPLFVVVIKLLS